MDLIFAMKRWKAIEILLKSYLSSTEGFTMFMRFDHITARVLLL
ncbi:MAG: hypothetical protein ACLTJ8_07725 [Veillonella atypica]